MTQVQLDIKNFRTHFLALIDVLESIVKAKVPDDVSPSLAYPEFKRIFTAPANEEFCERVALEGRLLREDMYLLPEEMTPAKELSDAEIIMIGDAMKPIAEIFYRINEKKRK